MARELLCIDDVDPYARECSDPLQELVQDLYHRLFEEPGENLDDPERGLGLLGMLSGPLTPNLQKLIEGECEKDERITKCAATVTVTTNGNNGDAVAIDLVVDINADDLNLEGYAIRIVKDNAGIRLVNP